MFSRIKSAGWGVLEKFTSAQANQLDIDHANALDKTTAGDTLSGVVALAATGAILVSTPGGIINSEVAGGIQGSAAGSIFPSVAGGISTAQPSGILSNVAAGISTATAGGIAPTVAGGIASGVVGGIALTGGATDYPTFGGTPRSFTRCVPMLVNSLASPWTLTTTLPGPNFAQLLIGGGTTQAQICSLPNLWNGARLSSVACTFSVNTSHSAVPANLPAIGIYRVSLSPGAGFAAAALSTSPTQSFPTPGSGSAYFAGGNTQSLIYTCNITANLEIDATSFVYFAVIFDENGTNSIAGNFFGGFQLEYTSVTSLAPQ